MRNTESTPDAEEPLIDTTAAIPLRSKRTERKQKKRLEKASQHHTTILDIPSELLIDILTHLRPGDIFTLSRVSRSFHQFTQQNETQIANPIIQARYPALARCFQLPILLENVDESAHPALQSEERQELLNIHKKPYQHIKAPDPAVVCTCLTCMLAWNYLCVVVDFARWQGHLDEGEPIPIIPRGKNPTWNRRLNSSNGAIVEKALRSPLWHALILERHLRSTVRSIRRHGNNKGNKRKRFRMDEVDVRVESDRFLERSGPPSLDFPFHRDGYYMLEAYLPNRGWNKDENRWMYLPASQHDRDVEMVKAWAARKKVIVLEEKSDARV